MKDKFTIVINANALNYVYSLMVNGLDFEKFTKKQKQIMKTWKILHEGVKHRVVLGSKMLS